MELWYVIGLTATCMPPNLLYEAKVLLRNVAGSRVCDLLLISVPEIYKCKCPREDVITSEASRCGEARVGEWVMHVNRGFEEGTNPNLTGRRKVKAYKAANW